MNIFYTQDCRLFKYTISLNLQSNPNLLEQQPCSRISPFPNEKTDANKLSHVCKVPVLLSITAQFVRLQVWGPSQVSHKITFLKPRAEFLWTSVYIFHRPFGTPILLNSPKPLWPFKTSGVKKKIFLIKKINKLKNK